MLWKLNIITCVCHKLNISRHNIIIYHVSTNLPQKYISNISFWQSCAQLPDTWIKARPGPTLLWYKPHCFSYVNHVVVMLMNFNLHKKCNEVCIGAESAPASPVFGGLVTEHRTVKWSITVRILVTRIKCCQSGTIVLNAIDFTWKVDSYERPGRKTSGNYLRLDEANAWKNHLVWAN